MVCTQRKFLYIVHKLFNRPLKSAKIWLSRSMIVFVTLRFLKSCPDINGIERIGPNKKLLNRTDINAGTRSYFWVSDRWSRKFSNSEICCTRFLQVILFEIDCAIIYTNLHELFCHFISWTNWVNSGKFMDNCWISSQVMADMKKVYDDLIIINLYDHRIKTSVRKSDWFFPGHNFFFSQLKTWIYVH